MDLNLATSSLAFLFGITSAKWALDLGLSQTAQLVTFILGLFIGPLVLLVLYLRLIRHKKSLGEGGAQIYGAAPNNNATT